MGSPAAPCYLEITLIIKSNTYDLDCLADFLESFGFNLEDRDWWSQRPCRGLDRSTSRIVDGVVKPPTRAQVRNLNRVKDTMCVRCPVYDDCLADISSRGSEAHGIMAAAIAWDEGNPVDVVRPAGRRRYVPEEFRSVKLHGDPEKFGPEADRLSQMTDGLLD